MRPFSLALVLTLLPIPLAGAQPATAPAATAPDNAADVYLEAFKSHPKPQTDEERSALWGADDPADAPSAAPNAASAALVKRGEHSLRAMRRAAGIERCDWSGQIRPKLDIIPSHLHRLLDLNRLALLRVRHSAADGRFEEAYEDLAAMLVMSRHAGQTPRTFARSTQFLIASRALDEAARHLPHVPPAVAAAFAKRIEVLPQPAPFEVAVDHDRKLHAQFFSEILADPKMRDVARRGSPFSEELAQGDSEAAKPHDAAGRPSPLDELWQDEQKRAKVFAELDRLMLQFKTLAPRPDQEYLKARPALLDEAKRAHPVVLAAIRTADEAWRVAAADRVRLLMVRAALAERLQGSDGYKSFSDPFGDDPFERGDVPGGYELKSKFVLGKERVTLRVGRAETQKP